MRDLSIALCVFFVAAQMAFGAGALKFEPALPKQGGKLTIHYTADSELNAQTGLLAIVYAFKETSSQPRAYEIPLTYNPTAKRHSGSLEVSPDAVYAMLKITDTERTDDNEGRFWDFLVSTDFTTPIRGANARAGISYLGNMPDGCKRQVDFERALELLQHEIELYPGNIQARIATTSLNFELKRIDRPVFEAEMERILSDPFDITRENYVRAASRALGAIGRGGEGQKMADEFINGHPESEMAIEEATANIASIKSPAEFVTKSIAYLQRFPTSELNDRIQIAAVQTMLKQNKVAEAEAYIDSLRYPSPSAYAMIAQVAAAKPEMQAHAEDLAVRAVDLARSPLPKLKPKFLADYEWAAENELKLGAALGAYGAALHANGKSEEALSAYTEAIGLLRERADASMFTFVIDMLTETGNEKEAFGYAEQALEYSLADNALAEDHRMLFLQIFPDKAESYEQHISELQSRAAQLRRANLDKEKLNLAPVQGSITTLDGKEVTMKDLRGKVVIIDFWATWCGPCKRSFPMLEELYSDYKSNDDVEFLIVNVWERKKDRLGVVQKFIKDNNYTLPFFMDPKDKFVAKFGVTGIPTKFYLDKQGRIQFKEVGLKPQDSFRQYAEDILALLLSDEFYEQ